jgi:predicted SAM-dependent methyltransferase
VPRYLADNPVRKLQIGTSRNVLPGWLNVDIIPLYQGAHFMDATERFPFDDGMFDYVFSEHMIEHVEYEQAQFMLLECFRVLKPGGRIRIATPDLEKLSGLYAEPKTPEQQQYVDAFFKMWFPNLDRQMPGMVINQLFDFEHKFLFDASTLAHSLGMAGFAEVIKTDPGVSPHAAFSGIDAHANDYIRFETLVMEAIRPG